jgi:hypothetical protein
MPDHSTAELDEGGRTGPTIAISMVGDLVVLRPYGHLDLESTRTLVSAVDAAAGGDSTVVIDLDGSAHRTAAELAFRSSSLVGHMAALGEAPTIDVIAPGCVRLSSPQSHWTIDLTEHRFCRSAAPVDRRFVAAEDWTSIRNVWATRDGVAVLTSNDAIISTATRWIAAVA